jgi:hypothetical protein
MKKIVVCHKSTNDGSAVTMMCGKDEKPWPSVAVRWRIVMAYARYKVMDTSYQ